MEKKQSQKLPVEAFPSADSPSAGPLEKVLALIGRAKAVEEEMVNKMKQTRHKYIELLLEQRIHLKWLELGERFKDELRKVVYADQRVQTYFNSVRSAAKIKETIVKKLEEVEQLRKDIKEERPVSGEDIYLAEAEVLSIESNINMTTSEELTDLEHLMEKARIASKDEFWDYLGGSVMGNFALTCEDLPASPSETPFPLAAFEEESKDLSIIKAGSTPAVMKSPAAAAEKNGTMIERVDTTLKVKNNRLYEKVKAEMHSDYGQYINALEFDNCCVDCDEAIKIGQLLNERESFAFRFHNTLGYLNVLLNSVGPKASISELCISSTSLEPFTKYMESLQKVRSVVVENLSESDMMHLGILVDCVGKGTSGRSLTLRSIDFAQVPIQFLVRVGQLRELHLVKCQLSGFEKLIEYIGEGKQVETLEIRGSLPSEPLCYEQLARLLRKDPALRNLNISENRIAPANLRILAKAMGEVKNVEMVLMDNCTYEKKDQTELEDTLFEIVRSSPVMKVLSLRGFVLNDDAKAMALLDRWTQQAPNIRSRVEFF